MPKPPRTFLEMDELVALIDAAGEQDAALARRPRSASRRCEDRREGRGALARRDAAASRSPPSSVSPRRPSATTPPPRGRGAARLHRSRASIVATLGRCGVRVSELCDLRHPRRAPARRGRRALPRSRTPRPRPASARSQMSPDLVEELVAHLDRLRRAGHPTGPTTTCSRTCAAAGSAASASPRSSARPRRSPPRRCVAPRASAAAEHDAAHAAADLHLDRAAGQQLRRHVGHEPGRPRRLEDDDRRLRAARSSASTASTARLRRPRAAAPGAALTALEMAP